jgi:hypothetical protein
MFLKEDDECEEFKCWSILLVTQLRDIASPNSDYTKTDTFNPRWWIKRLWRKVTTRCSRNTEYEYGSGENQQKIELKSYIQDTQDCKLFIDKGSIPHPRKILD